LSLFFVFLKAFGATGIVNTPYDKIIFLVLLDLDIIALFTVLRWHKIWK